MRLYSVLVVDDEAYIALCVAEMLAAAKDIELDVKSATSAEEALKIFSRERIDILLTDIEMPGVSGLQLAEQVLARWRTCRVLFLTAHSDFAYASQALRLCVSGYILKTQSDESILCEVRRVAASLDEELMQAARQSAAPAGVTHRREFLSLVGEGETAPADLGLGDGPLTLAAAAFADGSKPRTLYTLKMLVSHYVASAFRRAVYCEHAGRAYWLFEAYEERPDPDAWMTGTLETVLCALPPAAGVMLAFESDIADARRAFARVNLALAAIKPDCVVCSRPSADPPLPEDFSLLARRFRAALEERNGCEAMSCLQDLARPYRDTLDRASPSARAAYGSLASALIERKPVLAKTLAAPAENMPWASAFDLLAQATQEQTDGATPPACDSVIEQIKGYIGRNVFRGVTLGELSRLTGYNSSYLSRYFAEKCGETITAYLSRTRLAGIEALSRDESLSLNEISVRAGFESRSYFNRFIIRLTGLSPNKWRETCKPPKRNDG